MHALVMHGSTRKQNSLYPTFTTSSIEMTEYLSHISDLDISNHEIRLKINAPYSIIRNTFVKYDLIKITRVIIRSLIRNAIEVKTLPTKVNSHTSGLFLLFRIT